MRAADFGFLQLNRESTLRPYEPADLLDAAAIPVVFAPPLAHAAKSAAFVLEYRVLFAVVLDPITSHESTHWAQLAKTAPQLCRGKPRRLATLHNRCHSGRGVSIVSAEFVKLFLGYRGPRPVALGNATCDLINGTPGKGNFVKKALGGGVVFDEEGIKVGAELGVSGSWGAGWRAGRGMPTFRRLRLGARRRGRRALAADVMHIGRSFGGNGDSRRRAGGARRWQRYGDGSGSDFRTNIYRSCMSLG